MIIERNPVAGGSVPGRSCDAGLRGKIFFNIAVYRDRLVVSIRLQSGRVMKKIEAIVQPFKMEEVKEALKGSDSTAIKSASEKLNEAWQAVSTELYKAASEKARAGQQKGQPGSQPGPEDGGPQPEDGKKDEGPIIDAEVVDEKK